MDIPTDDPALSQLNPSFSSRGFYLKDAESLRNACGLEALQMGAFSDRSVRIQTQIHAVFMPVQWFFPCRLMQHPVHSLTGQGIKT